MNFGNSLTAGLSALGGLFGGSTGTLTQQNGSANSQGLFGNLGAAGSGNLFGNSKPSTGLFGQSTGLFGQSQANQTQANQTQASQTQTKPLFGASNTGTSAPGLFGNSLNAGATASGTANAGTGLFGNSGTKPGLFGANSAGASNTTNTSGSTGLFGNSNSTGLFGNSNTGSNNSGGASTGSTGLFGNTTNAGTGLFGSKPAASTGTGLFGTNTTNTNTTNANTGLFGGSNTGLFGNKATTNTSGVGGTNAAAGNNLFGGNAANANTVGNSNPFGAAFLGREASAMPQSITGSLLTPLSQVKEPAKTQPVQRKSSLLGRLAQTFNFFRSSGSESTYKPSGLFKQLNYLKSAGVAKPKPTVKHASGNVGDIKRLVIRNKPLKFHLINTDKVFKERQKRILVLTLPSHALKEQEFQTEDMIEPNETTEKTFVVEAPVAEKSGDYWCLPPLQELVNLAPEDLLEVQNFIVGRVGHGQIAYNYPVDLSSIFLRCNNDTERIKAALFGHIVRIDAPVCMVYRVDDWPKPKLGFGLNVPATITLLARPKRGQSLSDHIQRLKNLVGMEFVTFDPLTNHWTSKVKHFSVWGLIDEESVDTAERKTLRMLKKEQDSKEEEASMVYTKIYENDLYNQELKRQKIGRMTSGIPGGWQDADKLGGLLDIKQQIVKDEIDKQVTAYKNERLANALAANVSNITVNSVPGSPAEDVTLGIPLSLPGEDQGYLRQFVSDFSPSVDVSQIVDERIYEPLVDDEALCPKEPQLATSDDWLEQLELAGDLSSALTPYITSKPKKMLALEAFNDVLMESPLLTPQQAESPVKLIEDVSVIGRLIPSSLATTRDNGFPKSSFTESFSLATLSSVNLLYSLAAILFDPKPNQKQAFVAWLKNQNKDIVLETADVLDEIFAHVVLGNVSSAVRIAMASHNSHLAVLLSMLGRNEESVKSLAARQLEEWNTNEVSIPKPVLKVHQLLAGEFGSALRGLPYSVAIGVHALYGGENTLTEVLKANIDESNKTEWNALLKVYTNLESGPAALVSQLKQSNLSPILQWVIAKKLCSDEQCDYFTEALGRELEQGGQWEEAIFVYSSLSDDVSADSHIRGIVINHIDFERKEYLVQVLKVPESLVLEAVAIAKAKSGDFWVAGESFAAAGLWEEAHKNIVENLGPEAVISADFTLEKALLGLIDEFPMKGRVIPSWNYGAGIFKAYFRLTADNTKEELVDLLDSLTLYPKDTLEQRVAHTVMCKNVGDMALETWGKDVAQAITHLNVGENERVYFAARLAAFP